MAGGPQIFHVAIDSNAVIIISVPGGTESRVDNGGKNACVRTVGRTGARSVRSAKLSTHALID